MATPATKQGTAIDDDDYDRIVSMTRNAGRRGVSLTNKSGQHWRFYYKGKDLFGDVRMPDGSVVVNEVFKKSVVMAQQQKPFSDAMREKLEADYPDMSKEEKDFRVGMLTEANESIKNLIRGGMEPKQAHALIVEVLRSMEKTPTTEISTEQNAIITECSDKKPEVE